MPLPEDDSLKAQLDRVEAKLNQLVPSTTYPVRDRPQASFHLDERTTINHATSGDGRRWEIDPPFKPPHPGWYIVVPSDEPGKATIREVTP